MDLDKDTKQILTDADNVKSLLESDGWNVIHPKLVARMMDLQNIYNLDLTKLETLPQQLAARKMAVETIKEWLQQDVFGFVEQQEANSKTAQKAADESYIERT